MVKVKLKRLLRKVYEALTECSPDVLYYSGIFTGENKEWLMVKPIRFVQKLIWIRIQCMRKHYDWLNQTLIFEHQGIGSYKDRPKDFRYGEQFIGYDYVVIDIIGSLCIPCESQKETLLNPYMKNAIKVGIKNGCKVLAITDSSSCSKDWKEWLEKHNLMVEEVLTITQLQEKYMHGKDTSHQKKYIAITSNWVAYKKLKENCQKVLYYRSTSSFMLEMLKNNMTLEQDTVRLERLGIFLFDGCKRYDPEYYMNMMWYAPPIYKELCNIQKVSEELDAQVVIVSESDSEIANLYQNYIGDCENILWSPYLFEKQSREMEYKEIVQHNSSLKRVHREVFEKTITYNINKSPSPERIYSYLEGETSQNPSVLVVSFHKELEITTSFVKALQIANPNCLAIDYASITNQAQLEIYPKIESLNQNNPILFGIFEHEISFVMPKDQNKAKVEKFLLMMEDYLVNVCHVTRRKKS